jgi:V/A-type H+-transporting ATPase subunit I
MVEVDVLLLQRDLPATLRALAAAGIIHLQPLETAGAEEKPGAGLDQSQLDRFAAFLSLLQKLGADLGVSGGAGGILAVDAFPSWERWADELRRRLASLRQRQGQLGRLRDYLGCLALFLRRLEGVDGDFDELRHLRFCGLRLCLLPAASLGEAGLLASGILALPLQRSRGRILLALLFRKRQQTALEQRIMELGGELLPLPMQLSGTFGDALGRIRALYQKVRKRLKRLDRQVAALRSDNETLLQDRLRTIAAEVHLLQAGEQFGFTQRTVAIAGWVPERRYRDLEAILRRTCGERYILHHAAARGGRTPVLLANAAPVRPFQRMLAVLGTPAYAEIEPTPLLAICFVVLFGMMFGDVGHGLVLLVGGGLLRRSPRFRDYGTIIGQVGLSSAFFGILYGSVFGHEDLFPALWFSPMHDIPRLMLAAVVLGAGLILTGLALRILNGLRQDPFWAVATDRYGLAGLAFYGGGLLTAFLVYRQTLPPAALLWLLLPLVAVFCHPFAERQKDDRESTGMLLAEGAIEVLETVLGFLANTFSFLRVAAFGLAHAGLFMAVFAVADQVRELPIGFVWVTLVHVTGNLVILLLEGLVVSVQAVRLEFYEVFSKFFRGGGVAYNPLVFEPGRERRKGHAR